MKTLRLLALALLLAASTAAWATAADEKPKPSRSMPISKYWRRGFLLGPRVTQTRVPRVPLGTLGGKVDLNSCTLEQLQNLPGVGPALGAHILAGRPYRDFDDLVRDGVPLSTVDQLRTRILFGP
jgi:DNA uptake protein ComE-like DNA-binding protein